MNRLDGILRASLREILLLQRDTARSYLKLCEDTMKTITRRKSIRPALAAAAAFGITLTASGCGGGGAAADDAAVDERAAAPVESEGSDDEDGSDDEAGSEDSAEGDAGEGADDSSEGADSGESGGAAGEETQVEIGETLEDPDMGDSIEVLSAVRDFPSEEQADLIADGGEVVLLEVSVSPGEEYGGLVSMGDFEISWDDGADFWNNKTRMVEDELEAADYPVFEDVSRRDGGEHTGWIAFLADERADSYQMSYTRAGAEVIGSDELIDPFEADFEIPAS